MERLIGIAMVTLFAVNGVASVIRMGIIHGWWILLLYAAIACALCAWVVAGDESNVTRNMKGLV
ncbi:hypothetical protein LCGC14_0776460 [marine sediment metagenome]|uniref:Uncharacterized protein n=1 Tax=marine sediment metagenome TaxID=412755 RepID=A0A0F9T3S0_9ZZZZ